MGRMVALLRAVNVGGRKLPMAELRTLCGELGWTNVATYIQSGNVVFDARCTPAEAEAALEARIAGTYGYEARTVARTVAQWAAYGPACPFPEEAREAPNRLLMLLSKSPPINGADAAIQARAQHGERIARAGDAIWIYHPDGQADTKLTPAFLDKAIGSTATGRNYRTVMTLQEMMER